MTLAIATAAVGVVLFVLLLPPVLRSARRLSRERAALDRDLGPRIAALRALAARRPDRPRPGGAAPAA